MMESRPDFGLVEFLEFVGFSRTLWPSTQLNGAAGLMPRRESISSSERAMVLLLCLGFVWRPGREMRGYQEYLLYGTTSMMVEREGKNQAKGANLSDNYVAT